MASDDAKSHNNDDFGLENIFSVEEKVALITGIGSGISLMAAQALAVSGAKVYVVGGTKEKLETVKDGIAKLYDDFLQKEKHLITLINNVGISTATFNTEAGSTEELKKALFDNEEATFENWSAVHRTNSSTVINICYIWKQVKTTQHNTQYNAGKAETIHLNRMVANEIQESGLKIRVNSIAPGVFPSKMTAGEPGANQKSFVPKNKYAERVPAGRPGHDRDMANAILFAATNQYLNGQTVTVDDGYTTAAGR
ncbi:hypothetical protein LTR95_006920 [Oleoguttula sp. CCFEE 5521]